MVQLKILILCKKYISLDLACKIHSKSEDFKITKINKCN